MADWLFPLNGCPYQGVFAGYLPPLAGRVFSLHPAMMDIPDSPRIASETMPLVPAEASKRPKTPLPKLQIGLLMILEIAHAIALVSVYPYINQVFRNDCTTSV